MHTKTVFQLASISNKIEKYLHKALYYHINIKYIKYIVRLKLLKITILLGNLK